MQIDTEAEFFKTWLSQFPVSDRSVAEELVKRIKFVSADELAAGLLSLIASRVAAGETPLALYAERELRKRGGYPNKLFKVHRRKVKRASGKSGPPAVSPVHFGRPATGSEGIIANIITRSRRTNNSAIIEHPGPDSIRQNKVRRFAVVCDFIGSGNRVYEYLESAWKVESVKSWYSGGFLRFEVFCYSATLEGLKKLKSHRSSPKVFQVSGCPTVQTWGPEEARLFKQLCNKYGPKRSKKSIPGLGFGNIGALIAFDHGIPNNVPRMLIEGDKGWRPLFPKTLTSGTNMTKSASSLSRLWSAVLRLGKQSSLDELLGKKDIDPYKDLALLSLLALRKPPRSLEVVSSRMSISIQEAGSAVCRAQEALWVAPDYKLTEAGHAELEQLSKRGKIKKSRFNPNENSYYPTSLRAPKKSSS